MIKVDFKNGYTCLFGTMNMVKERLLKCKNSEVHQEVLERLNSRPLSDIKTDRYKITLM